MKLRRERVELEKQQSLNETTIEYVCNFMNQPSKLWKDANLESKQALQKMMFPNGLHINLKTKKCRTEDLSPLFSIMANKKAPEGGNSEAMVSHNPAFVEQVGITRMLIVPTHQQDSKKPELAIIKNYSRELLEYYYYLNSDLI